MSLCLLPLTSSINCFYKLCIFPFVNVIEMEQYRRPSCSSLSILLFMHMVLLTFHLIPFFNTLHPNCCAWPMCPFFVLCSVTLLSIYRVHRYFCSKSNWESFWKELHKEYFSLYLSNTTACTRLQIAWLHSIHVWRCTSRKNWVQWHCIYCVILVFFDASCPPFLLVLVVYEHTSCCSVP